MDLTSTHQIGTLVHAADLHLGAPLKALGEGLGDERSAELLRRSAQAFSMINGQRL
jgi:hypothetical protein